MSEPISVHVTTREGERRTVTQGAGHQTLMQVLMKRILVSRPSAAAAPPAPPAMC